MTDAECFNCKNKSTDAPLIKIEKDEKDGWVCVRCLPMLIHG